MCRNHCITTVTRTKRVSGFIYRSISNRNLGCDLTEVFNMGKLDGLSISKRNLRITLDKFRFRKNIGKNWFTDNVVDECYTLSKFVVDGNTFETCK